MSARSVVVSLEGPDCSMTALPVARGLADLEGGTLHIVVSSDRELAEHEVPARFGIDPEMLRGSVIHTRVGDAGRAVLAMAAEHRAALVVMCTRGAQDPPRRRLGDAARVVLAEGRTPVVLVRPERGTPPWKLEEVLVPHDGTPTTSAAICPAAELAARAGAQLLALHVASPGARPLAEPGSLRVPRYVDQPQHEWPAWAGEFLERLGSMCPLDPSHLRFFLGHGETGTEIVRVANEQGADMIVLAWHGTLGPAHAQVFKHLLREAPCPMFVLRVEA